MKLVDQRGGNLVTVIGDKYVCCLQQIQLVIVVPHKLIQLHGNLPGRVGQVFAGFSLQFIAGAQADDHRKGCNDAYCEYRKILVYLCLQFL